MVYTPAKDRIVVHSDRNQNGGEKNRITMIIPPNQKNYRQKLWINAVPADLCLFIVEPDEIDEFSGDIKELIFSSCFMMSARNVIVAIDMRNSVPTNELPTIAQVFIKAKIKIAKLLDRTVGQCYKIVPVDIQTGVNITQNSLAKHNFTWFSGPTLRQLVLEDQLRTNFDENAFKKLCEEPLKIQLLNCHKIRGIGTVLEGHVISGTIKPGDIICLHPSGGKCKVFSIESYLESLAEAKPGHVIGFNIKGLYSFRDILQRFAYTVKYNEDATVNCTMAFRASIAVLKPDRFTQHQVYNVLYGTSRIRCVLWWIFPSDGKNHDKSERKFKLELESVVQKPIKGQMKEGTFKTKLKEYREERKKEKESHARWQASNGVNFDRPPKDKLKKATAIILPLAPYDIEPYKATEFEKNIRGKLMIIEKSSVIGVGRVDRVINISVKASNPPTNQDYRNQYDKVVDEAATLFKLPTESNLLKLFLDHIKNNKHAKNSIREQKSLSARKAGPS
jgi:hypothetical protein